MDENFQLLERHSASYLSPETALVLVPIQHSNPSPLNPLPPSTPQLPARLSLNRIPRRRSPSSRRNLQSISNLNYQQTNRYTHRWCRRVTIQHISDNRVDSINCRALSQKASIDIQRFEVNGAANAVSFDGDDELGLRLLAELDAVANISVERS